MGAVRTDPSGLREMGAPLTGARWTWGQTFSYAGLSLSWKVLVTALLVILVTGYLMGALNASLSVGLTPGAVGEHYRDQSLTPEEAEVIESQGFVEESFSLDEEEAEGSPAGEAGMDHERSITPQELAQLAHVHLLGFSWILLATGGLLCLTRLREGIKAFLVGSLGLALLGDILGLFLTRFVQESFAWVTVICGIWIGICLGITVLRVFWELWGSRLPRPVG